MSRVWVVYFNFSKWYQLPVNEEQVLSDVREYDHHVSSIERLGVNQIEIGGNTYEYFAYLGDTQSLYHKIQSKGLTEDQLLALIEWKGIYAIRETEDFFFYKNVQDYLDVVLSNDDRVHQSKNGIIVESS